MQAEGEGREGPERWHGGLLLPRSGDRVRLLPGQQRVRGSFLGSQCYREGIWEWNERAERGCGGLHAYIQ
jgi:hypothetical protein